MKTTPKTLPDTLIKFARQFASSATFGAITLFCVASAPAAQLIWDPLFNGGTPTGSGNWDTTAGNTNWFNGTTDILWSQTGTNAATQGATFNGPDAPAGTYQITIDAVEVATTNLTINNNGYVFSGPNAIYLGQNEVLSVAPGKTVTFNCNIAGSGTSPFWQLGSGSVMNVTGNLINAQQVRIAGPADSSYNLSGASSSIAIPFILAPVNITGGSFTATGNFFIGYTDPATINGTAYTAGSLTVTNATINENGGLFIIARSFGGTSGGQGTFTVQNGSMVNIGTTKAQALDINYDGASANVGTVNMQGGTMNVGSSSFPSSSILLFASTGASVSSSTATLNQSGGTISTWGGIVVGSANGVGTATVTNSGGTLYIGNGISKGASYTGSFSVGFTGGTIGALGNWSSSLPITLGNSGGNATFQCADSGGTDHTITLSGPLTGSGGLNVTAGFANSGTLILSGANNYSGNTVVSNGTLNIVTSATPTISGPVTLDGTAGSPSVTVTVTTAGQYWTNNGAFTFQNGNTAANFAFGALSPSTSVAPIQVTGNVVFSATPNVNINGSAIAAGTYPLFKYTGTVSGTAPGSPGINLSGGSASGYLTNIVGSKTISLVVTSSTYNPALSWAVGNGTWDINTTANWKQFGSSIKYVDGDAVIFDDSATGPSPIAVTLNTSVNPLNVTFNNAAPTNYAISGSGSITGSGTLSVLNSGTVTLSGTNAYSGGTVVSAGQLNINNGGNASATAIGTGPLVINAGAALDNTSGSDVTLQANIPQTWNGNFSYVGSANGLNTGSGSVTMNGPITINVGGNNLNVAGGISDNGSGYKLTKTGNGALTLPIGNSFGGGLSVSGGTVNFGDPNAAGSGIFTISGGAAFDNISGAEIQLMPASYVWGGNFSFLGSTNFDLVGVVSIPNGLSNITMNVVSNTLTTFSDIINNNTTVIKTGNGTWTMAGSSSSQSLGLTISAGTVVFNKGGQAITGGNNVGLTVQTGGLAIDAANNQIRSDGAVPLPVNLSGGAWDLNGFKENVDLLSLSAGGTLRMGSNGATSTINLISGHTATLGDTNCQFDVASNGFLVFQGPIGGSGALVKVGAGTLNLVSNNVYTGDTVIANGTLALPNGGSISNTDLINLASTNSALDLTSNNSTTFTVLSGQTLSGFGTVTGLVQTVSGSVLAPGSASTIGTLTITGIPGANALGGTTSMKLNKTALTSDEVVASGSIVYGGTLALQNLSGSLANGDSFTLFSAGGGLSGTFASITPPTPGAGLAWNTSNLAINGKIAVMTGSTPTPPHITSIKLTGTTLAITGTNGTANASFTVLSSTNVAAALNTWTPVSTNSYDVNGNFNISFSVTNAPRQFFLIRD